MIEDKLEKALKPIPVPYDEFETFPKHVEEFFDLIARRPFELLQSTPGCSVANWSTFGRLNRRCSGPSS